VSGSEPHFNLGAERSILFLQLRRNNVQRPAIGKERQLSACQRRSVGVPNSNFALLANAPAHHLKQKVKKILNRNNHKPSNRFFSSNHHHSIITVTE
jgi:hypothetical protein